MSIFSKLFGGGKPKDPEPEVHKDFRIFVAPVQESGGYRLNARIEFDENGETRVHHMIRADTFQSLDEAQRITLSKAKALIDQQGKTIF